MKYVVVLALPGKPGKPFGERPYVHGLFDTKDEADGWITLQLLRNARLLGAFVVPLSDIKDLPVPEPKRNRHASSN